MPFLMSKIKEESYLFKAARGYVFNDCHITHMESTLDPLSIKVSPSYSILSVIKRLFNSDSSDGFSSLSTYLEEGGGRINLLHDPLDDSSKTIPFSGDIEDLFLGEKYDFFVKGGDQTERFRMYLPNSETGLGRILYGGRPLHRGIKINDIFKDAEYIKLRCLGTADVKFSSRTEEEIVEKLEGKQLGEIIKCLCSNHASYDGNVLGKMPRKELILLHALEHSPVFPASIDDVLEGLTVAEYYCVNTMCNCSIADYEPTDVREGLEFLMVNKIILKNNGLYGRTKEDFGYDDRDSFVDDGKVADHPDQTYFEFAKPNS